MAGSAVWRPLESSHEGQVYRVMQEVDMVLSERKSADKLAILF